MGTKPIYIGYDLLERETLKDKLSLIGRFYVRNDLATTNLILIFRYKEEKDRVPVFLIHQILLFILISSIVS